MDVSQDKIEALLKQAEADLADDPKLYQRKLLRYSLLGYGIILFIVLLLAGLVAGSVMLALSSSLFLLLLLKKKLIIPLVIMVWVLFKSVFIRWPKPQGIEVTRAHAPALFDLIDEIRDDLKTPPIHQVILTPEFNAAIVQTPRFLAFGFTHNTLVLGLELLLSLSTAELKSVIAHELAHLSGNHSKFNGWIYQARISWQNMMFNLDQHNGWTTAPIRRFFHWYSPRFSAYSFALARQNEYEADKTAAELTSANTAGAALAKIPSYTTFTQDNYWKVFNESVREQSTPEKPFAGLVNFLNQHQPSPAQIEAALLTVRRETTNYQDTHPCLNDRLLALDCAKPSMEVSQSSAAQHFFGKQLDLLVAEMDDLWIAQNTAYWRAEHEYYQEQKHAYESLTGKSVEDLDQEALWQLSTLTEQFGEQANAIALLRDYIARYEGDMDAHFVLGRILIEQGDDSGLAYLETACQKHEHFEPAIHIAYGYLLESNRIEEANRWREKRVQLENLFELASKERQLLKDSDPLVAFQNQDKRVAQLIAQIESNTKVKAAWIAAKPVEYFKDSPIVIIAIQQRRGFSLSDDLIEKLVEKVEVDPNVSAFFVTNKSNKKLFKRVKAFETQVI